MKRMALAVFCLLIVASVSAKEIIVEPVLVEEPKVYEDEVKKPVVAPASKEARNRSRNTVALGVGGAVAERIYKTKTEFEVRALPNIGIRYDRFYVRGIEIGAYLYEDSNIGVAAFVDVMGRFRVKASDMREGYQNINDRKDKIMYGVKLEGRNMPYRIMPSVSYKENDNGGKGELVIGRPIMMGPKLMLFPAFTATAYSGDLIGYYFGVSEEEVNRSTTDRLDRVYHGDMAYMYGFRLSVDYRWTEHISLSTSVGVQQFSGEIKNSPITENDGMIVFGAFGIRYTF